MPEPSGIEIPDIRDAFSGKYELHENYAVRNIGGYLGAHGKKVYVVNFH